MSFKKSLIGLGMSLAMCAGPVAFADHNSVWGEGWANMPNDIHNSAIEDDQDTFMDLVQYGDGADSVNRYLEDDAEETTTGSSRLDMWSTDMTDTVATDTDMGGRNLDTGSSMDIDTVDTASGGMGGGMGGATTVSMGGGMSAGGMGGGNGGSRR